VAIRKTLNPPELAEAGTFPTAANNIGTIIKNPRALTGREEPTDAKHRAGCEHYDTLLPRAFTKSKIFLFTNAMSAATQPERATTKHTKDTKMSAAENRLATSRFIRRSPENQFCSAVCFGPAFVCFVSFVVQPLKLFASPRDSKMFQSARD
jgi:hypothetical protein